MPGVVLMTKTDDTDAERRRNEQYPLHGPLLNSFESSVPRLASLPDRRTSCALPARHLFRAAGTERIMHLSYRGK